MFLYIPNIIPVYLNKLKWKLIFVFLENQALFFMNSSIALLSNDMFILEKSIHLSVSP